MNLLKQLLTHKTHATSMLRPKKRRIPREITKNFKKPEHTFLEKVKCMFRNGDISEKIYP